MVLGTIQLVGAKQRASLLIALIALAAAATLGACIKDKPVHRLATPTDVAVAFVHDRGGNLEPVPDEVVAEIDKALSLRNLEMRRIGGAAFEADFARIRDSRDRLSKVAALAGGAPLVLLVELRADYYTQLEGKFRWTVYSKLSLAKTSDLQSASVTSFDMPAMLLFNHHKEPEALVQTAPTVSNKLGKALDNFLAGLELTTTPTGGAEPAAGPSASTVGNAMYFVLVDRFANGDTSNDSSVDPADPQAFHGGDLRGIIERLDHIQSMGFDTLWLSPIYSMRTEKIGEHGAFHGYWTSDLREVEPRFGSDEDLLELRRELDQRGMSLVMDMVLNHVGYDTPLVTDKPEWFHHNGDIKDWNDPVQLVSYDVHGLPDLAQEKQEVYDYLVSASAHWAEVLQPAGFRLDAVKHVSNDFWRRYTVDLREQGIHALGELYDGNPEGIARGFREGGFDSLFDFPLYFSMTDVFCKGMSVKRLAATLSLDRLYPDPGHLVTFADNHDLPRLASSCGGDEARIRALLTFMLSARGTPCIYYGTEMGMAGQNEAENRADMRFGAEAPYAGLIRQMLSLRGKHPVLREGRDMPLIVDDEHFAYLRVHQGRSALVLMNLSRDSWAPTLSLPGIRSLDNALTHDTIELSALSLPPMSTELYFLRTPDAETARSDGGLRKLRVVVSGPGHEMRIVGGGPELGSWTAAKGVKGVLRNDSRFQFDLELPAGSILPFKLVSVTGETETWEERDNRYLLVLEGSPETIELDFHQTPAKAAPASPPSL